METRRHEIGMIGYDTDTGKVEALQKESAGNSIHGVANIKDFIGLLRGPRAVMMPVPAGPSVDSKIGDVLPHLEKGDFIIDAGDSYFKDTDLRARNLTGKGIPFLGVGVSGGEQGARHGPSIMPGGSKGAYERVRRRLETVARIWRGGRVIRAAIERGLPTPCFMTARGYFDGYRSGWLPANPIQAQCDYFGAHSYERIDVKGTFRTDWTRG